MSTFVTDRAGHRTVHRFLFCAFFSQLSNLPKLYLVALDGKPPREVLSGVLAEWTDGPNCARVASRRSAGLALRTTPPDGWASRTSRGRRTERQVGTAPEVERQIKEAAIEFHNFQWVSRARLSGRSSQGVRNLWRVESPRTLRWVAGPERLTTGAGRDTDIALAPDGRRLAFTTRIERTRVWSPPFDAAVGKVSGTGQPVQPRAGCSAFRLSRDGRQLAFVVDRAGKQELRKKSLADGSETLLVAADGMFRQGLRWTSDGSRLAHNRRRFTNPGTRWERASSGCPQAAAMNRY